MKKSLSALCVLASVLLFTSRAPADSALEVDVGFALSPAADGVAVVTPIVEYDHEVLSGRFARSGDIRITVTYVAAENVTLLQSTSGQTLSATDGLAYLPEVNLRLNGQYGRVVARITAWMGSDSHSLGVLPIFLERETTGPAIVDIARYAHGLRSVAAAADTGPANQRPDGTDVQGTSSLGADPRPDCNHDICL